MTDIDQGAEVELDGEPGGKGSLKKWIMIAGAALLLLVGGAAAWYFVLGGRAHFAGTTQAEAPLPYFLELKPFVVTVTSRAGPTHFVQLGLTLQIPGPPAAELLKSILPKVEDELRLTVLRFKSDDMQTPAGLDKVRAALRTDLNAMLVKVLGPGRIAKADDGKPGDGLVRQIEFTTLVVE